jgi:hypothetical protein
LQIWDRVAVVRFFVGVGVGVVMDVGARDEVWKGGIVGIAVRFIKVGGPRDVVGIGIVEVRHGRGGKMVGKRGLLFVVVDGLAGGIGGGMVWLVTNFSWPAPSELCRARA